MHRACAYATHMLLLLLLLLLLLPLLPLLLLLLLLLLRLLRRLLLTVTALLWLCRWLRLRLPLLLR